MQSHVKLSEAVQKMLRCPICKAKLELAGEQYQCQNLECNFLFPIINGIPILIDEDCSLFSIDDFVNRHGTTYFSSQTGFGQTVKRFLPDITRNIKGRENFNKLAKLLLDQSSNPKVLVIVGSILGEGMEAIIAHTCIELVDSDAAFGPRTTLVCSAHILPFLHNSF